MPKTSREITFNPETNKISYGGNTMTIWGRSGNDIAINICRLMFGFDSPPDADDNTYTLLDYISSEYVPGGKDVLVSCDDLAEVLNSVRITLGEPKYSDRAVYDAIIGINEKSLSKLGIQIFEINEEGEYRINI